MNEITIPIIIKNCGYIAVGVLGATGLESDAVLILSVFMLVDTLTGIIRAGITKGWRNVTSMKLMSGIIAKLLVLLVPLIIAIAGIGAGIDLRILAKAALSILILAEAYSILGNIHACITKKDSKEFDAVAYILTMFRTVVENFLSKTGNKK